MDFFPINSSQSLSLPKMYSLTIFFISGKLNPRLGFFVTEVNKN